MLKLLGCLLVLTTLRVAAAIDGVAPGDEDQLCTETLPAAGVFSRTYYPTNIKVLMDSYNYETLLPPQQNPVWQQVDLDTNNPTGTTTNWIQQGANSCRGTVFVCGFSANTQNNWLITQLINRTVDGVRLQQVNVQLEYELKGCEESLQCQRLFEVHKYETSSVDTTGARNTSNYELVTSVAPTVASGQNRQNETITIEFDTETLPTSFYLAIRDITSCILIARMLIFYTVCPSETSDLSIRSETIAPIDSTLLQISTQCVPNAGIRNSGGSSQSISVCSQGGVWTTLPNNECTCKPGFLTVSQMCIGCFAGEYFSYNSSMCQSCPANSNSTERGVTECPCFDGYYRAMGEEDLPCTSPPSAPRNVEILLTTNTSVSLRWDPPEDLGERDDFFYTLIAIEESTMATKSTTTVEGNITTGVLQNLAPGLDYLIYVIAENGITDQLQLPDRLQSLGTSVTVTTRGGTGGGTSSSGVIIGVIVAVIVIIALLLLIIAVVIYIAVRRGKVGSKGYYPGEAIDLPTTGARMYVDPSVYASPDEAIQDFATEIPPKSLRLDEEIGRGEFGTVYRGTWKQQPGKSVPIAVKTLKPGSSVKMRSDFLNEAAIMGQFDHPNVISLYGVITKVEPAMIVMEFMDNGSLYSYLRHNDEKLGLLRLVKMARGVASGMDYLATVGFVHRDLAARNILVSKEETCKVADFGLSRETVDDEYDVKKGGKIPVRWTAPEAIYRRKFTTSSDVWSFGVLLWEIMSYAQHPYDGYDNQTVLDRLEAGLRLEKPLGTPDMVYNIMLECWHHDNTRRPSFTSIFQSLEFLLETNLGQSARNGSNHPPTRPPKPKKSAKKASSAKNPLDYQTVDDWLQSIKMDRYAPYFENNGVTTVNQLVHITEDDLRQMGITLAGHLHRITESVEAAQLHMSRQPSTRI